VNLPQTSIEDPLKSHSISANIDLNRIKFFESHKSVSDFSPTPYTQQYLGGILEIFRDVLALDFQLGLPPLHTLCEVSPVVKCVFFVLQSHSVF
jgi:hypothetical protein